MTTGERRQDVIEDQTLRVGPERVFAYSSWIAGFSSSRRSEAEQPSWWVLPFLVGTSVSTARAVSEFSRAGLMPQLCPISVTALAGWRADRTRRP
jgi:hypothetical protein